jgi:acetylornithine/N-succinyldiaminopimelate aminotransferase
MNSLQKRFESVFLSNYGVPPLALARGEGCTVWDVDGDSYLDLISGIATSSLGHAHPALIDAVTRQVSILAHTSNLFLHEPEVRLAEKLVELLGHQARVFFCNSGTEANETAYKLVRRHAGPGRTYVVAADKSFHGRTMGALALTGKTSIREPFGPFPTDVTFVPFGDVAALEAAITDTCAAVFLEPTQGEGGIVPAPAGYLAAARRLCDASGALLVLDEIQSGIGRTGTWFEHQREGIVPDILTLAKGLGGGLPIGACVSFGLDFQKGDHGSTFGGNPVACAAALAVLETIEEDGLLDPGVSVGELLTEGLGEIEHPLFHGVRGRGLWLGAVLTGAHAGAVEAAARKAGFLVNAVQPEVIRIAPPLILTSTEAQTFLDAFPTILDEAAP